MKMWGFEAKRARKFTRTSPRTLPCFFHYHFFSSLTVLGCHKLGLSTQFTVNPLRLGHLSTPDHFHGWRLQSLDSCCKPCGKELANEFPDRCNHSKFVSLSKNTPGSVPWRSLSLSISFTNGKVLSGTGDSPRNAIRANQFARIIRNCNPYVYTASARFARITRISDSRKSPDSRESCESIRPNHATKARSQDTPTPKVWSLANCMRPSTTD